MTFLETRSEGARLRHICSCTTKAYKRNGGKVSTLWHQMEVNVSFMLQTLYPQGKSPKYPLERDA
jgi:hypothetical protein